MIVAGPSVGADARARVQPALVSLAERAGGVAIATCQRIECYLAWDGETHTDDVDGAVTLTGIDLPDGTRIALGRDAIRHALRLALGLESAALGEDQVLHQVRGSVAVARARAPLPPVLESLFDIALRAGRRGRSWRPGRGRSLADLAVDLIAAREGSLTGRRILVVGTGEIGRLTVAAAAGRGADVAVTSPTPAHAREVAASLGATAWPFDPGERLRGAAGAVVALAGPWSASEETFDRVADLPIVVDLSAPPAIPSGVAARLGSRLVDVDRLAADAQGLPDEAADVVYRRRLESLLDEASAEVAERLAARDAAAVARAIAARIERERTAALDELWRRLPNLDTTDRAAIEGMTRHLAERLFHPPLERLGRDPDGRRQRAARELFGL